MEHLWWLLLYLHNIFEAMQSDAKKAVYLAILKADYLTEVCERMGQFW